MAEFPHLPLFTDAYLSDTRHLSAMEHGAYLLLLMMAWRAPECRLPDDDTKLAKWACVDARTWRRIKPTIMEFWSLCDGCWTQHRLSKEREFVSKRAELSRKHGRLGGRPKSLKNNDAENPEGSSWGTQVKAPIPIPTQKEEKIELRSIQKTAKGTRLSEDWVLPKEFSDWAVSRGLPPQRVSIEAEKMRNWSINAGKTGVKVDWFAAWRNWVQKALDDMCGPPARGSPKDDMNYLIDSLVTQMDHADANPTTETQGYQAAPLRLSSYSR